MKIIAEKWIVDNSISYKIIDIKECCDKIINSKNTCLNEAFDKDETYYNSEGDYSIKLFGNKETTDWEDTFSEDYYEKINYCPWCGEKIEIEIINTIDKTEEYNELNKQRDDLWKKCRKTDSKKKENELNFQVKELDIRINQMLTSDDFKKEEI